MIFSSFFEEFPELVESEFRNIFVFGNDSYKYIPPGNYAFLELFCPDLDCDCRKVIINIVSVNPTKVWAVLNYGWESEEYYQTWWGTSHKHYKPMSGITFDPPTKDPLKNEFLTVFQDILNSWKHLVEFEGEQEKQFEKYPVCLEGARACPPEDVGGIPGYENFIAIIKNPRHKERKSLLEWVGGKYDPEKFDPKKVKFDNSKTRWQKAFT